MPLWYWEISEYELKFNALLIYLWAAEQKWQQRMKRELEENLHS